jgi:hypothetical protein
VDLDCEAIEEYVNAHSRQPHVDMLNYPTLLFPLTVNPLKYI